MLLILNTQEKNLVKVVKERLKGKSLCYISKNNNMPKSIIDNRSIGKHQSNFVGQCVFWVEEELKPNKNIILASTWNIH